VTHTLGHRLSHVSAAQRTGQRGRRHKIFGPQSERSMRRAACAGVLVLEELEHARARGAPILAEYIGGSFTCDAHHMTEPLPDGTGVGRCIAMCAAAGRPALQE